MMIRGKGEAALPLLSFDNRHALHVVVLVDVSRLLGGGAESEYQP